MDILNSENMSFDSPIFVVGPARSGTSVMGNMLRSVLCAQGFSECHVLPLLSDIIKAIDEYYAVLPVACENKSMFLSQISPEHFKKNAMESFKQLYERNMAGRIIDKTPGHKMIRAMPDIISVWKNAKFIFMKRRGIENVMSQMKKWPDAHFQSLCSSWAGAMSSWLKVKGCVFESNRIEIDQVDIRKNPEDVSEIIVSFLGLDVKLLPSVLDYLKHQKPEMQQHGQSGEYIDIDDTGWTGEQKQMFRHRCGLMMKAYHYEEHV